MTTAIIKLGKRIAAIERELAASRAPQLDLASVTLEDGSDLDLVEGVVGAQASADAANEAAAQAAIEAEAAAQAGANAQTAADLAQAAADAIQVDVDGIPAQIDAAKAAAITAAAGTAQQKADAAQAAAVAAAAADAASKASAAQSAATTAAAADAKAKADAAQAAAQAAAKTYSDTVASGAQSAAITAAAADAKSKADAAEAAAKTAAAADAKAKADAAQAAAIAAAAADAQSKADAAKAAALSGAATDAASKAATAKSEAIAAAIADALSKYDNARVRVSDWTVTGKTTINGGRIEADSVTAGQIGANAIVARNLAANSVIAGKVAANAITATAIAANAISAKHLAIADTSNMAELSVSQPGNVSYAGWQDEAFTAADGSTWLRRNVPGTTSTYFMFRNQVGPIPFKPGDRIRATFEAYASAATVAGMSLWTYPSGTGSSGSFINKASNGTGIPLTTTPQTFAMEIVVTQAMVEGRTSFLVGISSGAFGNGTAEPYVRNVSVRLMNAGELVVEGSITATSLATDSVTTDKLQASAVVAGKIAVDAVAANNIQANAVVSSKIAADAVLATHIVTDGILARHIKANEITANKMALNTITAASGVIGSIDASKITVGKITAAQMAANTITAASGVIGSIDAAKITVGQIQASQLSADAINGKTINGAVITGGTITGGTMTGTTLRTAATGPRVEVNDNGGSGGAFRVYTASPGEQFPGGLAAYGNGDFNGVVLGGSTFAAASSGPPELRLSTDVTTGVGSAEIQTGKTWLSTVDKATGLAGEPATSKVTIEAKNNAGTDQARIALFGEGDPYVDSSSGLRLDPGISLYTSKDISLSAARVVMNGNAFGGNWVPFTPVWRSGGVAMAIGNGTIQGWYLDQGPIRFVRVEVVRGSTTNVGGSIYAFDLPPGSVVGSRWRISGSGFYTGSSGEQPLAVRGNGTGVAPLVSAGGRLSNTSTSWAAGHEINLDYYFMNNSGF